MGSGRILDAAGITDPALREAYEQCRRQNAARGATFYLATRLLPPAKRPYLWALFGFARRCEEVLGPPGSPRPAELRAWAARFLGSVFGGTPDGPAEAAMRDTMRRWAIPRLHVEAFLDCLRCDAEVTGYACYADLERHLSGFAAIGMQVLPILQPLTPEAAPRARALGEAFRMSTVIRDVGQDLSRGRVYLPQEDLDTFGVTREALARGAVTPTIRELLRFEIERARALYAFAEPGVAMVHPTSRDGVRTAFALHLEILDAVERAGCQVLTRRPGVPRSRRLAVALPRLRQARAVRREQRRWVAA